MENKTHKPISLDYKNVIGKLDPGTQRLDKLSELVGKEQLDINSSIKDLKCKFLFNKSSIEDNATTLFSCLEYT